MLLAASLLLAARATAGAAGNSTTATTVSPLLLLNGACQPCGHHTKPGPACPPNRRPPCTPTYLTLPCLPTTQNTGLLSVIYHEGLQAGWRSASYGCIDCSWTDTVHPPRAVSTASAYMQIAPWAAFVLESDTPFTGSRQAQRCSLFSWC